MMFKGQQVEQDQVLIQGSNQEEEQKMDEDEKSREKVEKLKSVE